LVREEKGVIPVVGGGHGRSGPDFDWSWTQEQDGWLPPVADRTGPSDARLYDYLLGGKDHVAVDRQAAERMIRVLPGVERAARLNRNFVQRAVRALLDEGITQFIDLGSGLPTSLNVHEMAQRADSRATVAYVDNDPLVITHQRAVFAGRPRVVTVQQDLCRPWEVLSDEGLRGVIDFGRPVGVLLIAVLQSVSHEVAPELLARYRRALPSGSCIVMNVACRGGLSLEQVAGLEAVFSGSAVSFSLRTSAQIHQLFDGLEVLPPGIVDFTSWRGDDPGSTLPGLAGVGRIP
jgi:O-methyltransferase involved in polyketide biosynthesis